MFLKPMFPVEANFVPIVNIIIDRTIFVKRKEIVFKAEISL